MNRLPLRRPLAALFALILLVWCVRYLATAFHWQAVFAILRADHGWLTLASPSILLFFGVRSARWLVMFRATQPGISFLERLAM
jgi:hypothetical protein